MNIKKLLLFSPLIVFFFIGLFLLRGISLDPDSVPSALIGKKTPEFSLFSIDGKTLITNKDLYGRVALLNVWATWCGSCRLEHAALMNLSKNNVVIVGINYKDNISDANIWLDKLGNPYQLVISDPDGKLGLDLGVAGAPETFLIDKEGIIRYKRTGIIDENIWRYEISPLYFSLLD